jgi:hypothetical protein
MMDNKQPGIVKYLPILVRGLFLSLGGLLAVYLLVVSMVRLQATAAREPSGSSPKWPTVGDPAPDFVLKDTEGRAFHLQSQAGKAPLVLQLGSFT